MNDQFAQDTFGNTEPLTSFIRRLAIRGSSALPSGSRASRFLRDVASTSGLVADLPGNVRRVAVGLPRQAGEAAMSGLGSAVSYALEDPSVAQPSVAPTAETVPPRQIGPSPMPSATPIPLSPEAQARSAEDLRPLEIDTTEGAAKAAAAYRPPARAIRLPDGRVLFTNRDELGGEELTTAQGGEIVRAKQRSEAPARAALTGMLRASMRATQREAGANAPLPRGRMVEGETPEMRPGLSTIEGTPEIQRRLSLDEAMGALASAQVRQEIERANLSPEKRASLEDPNVRAMEWVRSNIQPKINAIQQWAESESARVRASVPDAREQAKQLSDIDETARQQIASLNTVASAGSRQRLPQEY